MVQMRVDCKQPETNLRRAEEGIEAAAAAGCRFVVLPECLDVGWGAPDAVAHADEIPGARTERLGRAAARHGVYVVAGLTEREVGRSEKNGRSESDSRVAGQGARCYNTAVVIGPDGRLLGKHRKINLLPGVEDMVYSVGDRLAVYDMDSVRVGVNICADNFLSHLMLGRSLAAMGAKIILSPCAWAVTAESAAARKPYGAEWLESFGVLARECGIWVVGVSNVGDVAEGVWKGWKCIGNSIAMSPDGPALIMGYGEDAESVAVVDVAI